MLNQELRKAKDSANDIINTVANKRKNLQEVLPDYLLPSVILHCRHTIRITRNEVAKRHLHKLNHLSSKQDRPLFNVHDTVRFHDIDVIPPRYVLDTLAIGPNNAVLDMFNSYNVLAELNLLLKKCDHYKISNETINDINIVMVKYIKQASRQRPPRHLKLTQLFLKKHNLLAVPFDKGTGFCVMKSETYEKKLMDILELPQFEKLVQTRKNAKDFVLKEEDRILDALLKLKEEGKIDDELYDRLKPKGSQPPRLYGLAKVHKTIIPLRPVVSMPGSPYHKVSQKVAEWLSVVPEA